MSKKLFTEKEIKILSKNKNILKVPSKSIVYALEFRCIIISNRPLEIKKDLFSYRQLAE